MKISTKGRYALRVMLDLAANDTGDYIPLRDISTRQEITPKYLEKILADLGKAGYIKSARGSGGGHRLARPPQTYTAGEILRAMEGHLCVVSCLEEQQNTCPRNKSCLTLPFWEGLSQTVNNYIDNITLEDILREPVLQER